nr:glycosyltransferase [Szabonella alba]
MPARNHAGFVDTALQSVLAQSHERIELIVIDDGSTDETPGVIERCLSRTPRSLRVEFHCQPNQGLGPTLSRALGMARGDFVQFLASDDALFPDMTARLVRALSAAAPDVAAMACDGYVFDGQPQVLDGQPRAEQAGQGPHLPFSQLHPAPLGRNQHRELMVGNWLPAMGLLYRHDLVLAAGGIDPDLAYEDWGLLLALTRRYRIAQIPDRLFLYRQHGQNSSVEPERMQLALRALTARFPQMAGARKLRAALAARDMRGILAGLAPGNLDLAARFLLRQIQRRSLARRGQPALPAAALPAATLSGGVFRQEGQIEIGPGCRIHPEARLEAGPGRLILGPGCHVGAGARLEAGPGLTIGAGTFIEAGARIGGAGARTRLGRACLIAARTRILPGSLLGDLCVTMPESRVGGPHPDGRWLVPSAGQDLAGVSDGGAM